MSSARTSVPPALRQLRPEDTARALRVHFARHNRRVLLFSAITLLSAAALWSVLYGVCCWLIVLAAAVFEYPLTRVPPGFRIVFAVAAICAVIYTWIDRRLTPDERPEDKRAGDVVADFLLAIPRMTLAVPGTLAAWQRLSGADLAQAATLLHRLLAEKRVAISSVRLDLPDPASALRILFALQLTRVVETQREDGEFCLRLNALRSAELRLGRGAYADA